MSRRFKFNVNDVTFYKKKISGLQIFSDLLTGDKINYNGFSSLVPKAIPLRKPDCNYCKQDYFPKNALNFPKISTISPPSGGRTLKSISSEVPIPGKRLNTLNFNSVRPPTPGFPWSSAYRFYYDVPKPQCSLPAPEQFSDDGNDDPKEVCSSEKIKLQSITAPCFPRTIPKLSPSIRKMSTFGVPINTLYRSYAAGARKCTPRGGGKKSGKSGGRKKGPVCPSQKKSKGGGRSKSRCSRKKGGGGSKGRSKCSPKGKGKKKGKGKSKCGSKKSGSKKRGSGQRKCGSKKSGSKKSGSGQRKCGSKKSGSKKHGTKSGGRCKGKIPGQKRPGGKSGRGGSKCKPRK